MDYEVMSISEIKALAILAGALGPCDDCNSIQSKSSSRNCMKIIVDPKERIRYCSCAKKEVFEGGLRQWMKEQSISKTA